MKHWYILLFTCANFAQNDSINLLDEVKLYGNFSSKLGVGHYIQILSDSIINSKQQSLGNLLQNQANIYLKQQGNGMVSSISLRGSGASHTGVYWNGIAINSTLNGQTDFNTLSANGYNQIEIRKGAGSTLFGSGAIGGAINLRDKIYFFDKKELTYNAEIASYNTQSIFLKTNFSTKKIYSKISFEKTKSDNDYPFLNTKLVNENGAYKNHHIKTVFAYKINSTNQIRFFTTYSNNDRELSRTLTAPSKSKYKNEESRLMLNWTNFGQKYNSSLKLAFLNEAYNFYLNKEIGAFSYGRSDNYITKYDLKYFLNNDKSIHYGLENKYSKGEGSSLLKKEKNKFETYILFHHQPIEKINYNLSLRKGISSIYKIPLIYAIDLKYDLSPIFNIRANISTNYKLPTFNDLFWNFSGNENLLAENNKTMELGFNFHAKKTKITFISYLTNSTNLIQWQPVSSTFWKPINIQKVSSYGGELEYKTDYHFKNHKLGFQTQYTYTVSKDVHLTKQLIYVPFHKANIALNYTYKRWNINFNQQYNGKVFTTTSNTQVVTDFWLSNVQLSKTILKNKVNIRFIIHNLFDKAYQTVAYRPMPNRNLKLNINIKI